MAKPVVLLTDAELDMGASLMARFEELASVVTAPDDEAATLAGLAPQADVIFRCYASITGRQSPRRRGCAASSSTASASTT